MFISFRCPRAVLRNPINRHHFEVYRQQEGRRSSVNVAALFMFIPIKAVVIIVVIETLISARVLHLFLQVLAVCGAEPAVDPEV